MRLPGMHSLLLERPWIARREAARQDTLAPYFRHGFFGRRPIVTGFILALIATSYGLIYGVTSTYLLVQLMIPVAAVSLFAIFLLPENGVAFEGGIGKLFLLFFFALAVWPDYLAFELPGLPWFTVNRLLAVPICILFLVSLSQSGAYRSKLASRLRSSSPVWKYLLGFFILSAITLPFSDKPMESVNKLIVAIYAWGVIFLVAVQFFSEPGRVRQFAQMLWVGLLVTCLVGLLEFRWSQVPWAGRVPSFLKIEDPTVVRVLSGAVRAAIGEHRVQAKFTTPLSLAEFLALSVPFLIHFMVTGRGWIERAAAALTLPLVLFVIVKTDARLGVIGFSLAILGYMFFWALRRWQRVRGSILPPLIVVGYPAMLVVLLLATFFVGRLRNAVWGGGAYQASNDAREQQLSRGLEMILQQPWGYGTGRAAEALGFVTDGEGFLTIDSYYLSIALDVGILGFIAYYGAFLIALWKGAQLSVRASDDEATGWLVPTLLSLANYIVIKSILSQQESHPFAFAMLGLTVAMIHQIKRKDLQMIGKICF